MARGQHPTSRSPRDREETVMNRKAMGGLVVAGALLIGAPAWSAAQDAPRASLDGDGHVHADVTAPSDTPALPAPETPSAPSAPSVQAPAPPSVPSTSSPTLPERPQVTVPSAPATPDTPSPSLPSTPPSGGDGQGSGNVTASASVAAQVGANLGR